MAVKIDKFYISTVGFDDIIDITSKVNDMVSNANTKEGIVNIFTSSSTSSILTIENEPGLNLDLTKLLENIVPINKIYQHDNIWYEGNANAHLKASILKNSISLPLIDGKIALGQYQKLIFIDFDSKAQNKEIIVTIAY